MWNVVEPILTMNNLSFGEKFLKFPPARILVSSGLKLQGNFKIDFVDIELLKKRSKKNLLIKADMKLITISCIQ